ENKRFAVWPRSIGSPAGRLTTHEFCGRSIYDNERHVLQEIRNRMTAHGFDPLRVSPSALPVDATAANQVCNSFYGDSAMLEHLSQLIAAIAGGGEWAPRVGVSPQNTFTVQNGLRCTTGQYNTGDMIWLPAWHPQPTFFDVHSQRVFPTTNETATWAKNFYDAIWNFMVYRGKTEDYVVFGETNPIEPSPYNREGCAGWTADQASAMLYGIPGLGNGYKNSTLFINRPANVVMRPWHRTEALLSCSPSPNVINPPFNPRDP
ncbi:MAG: hypothetical protein ACRD8O_10360, partial [Bryobacteraceae bacterium]